MGNFEELVSKFEPMIYKIMNSLHIYKNKDEFYQLGLISLWEAKERFDPEKGAFSSYAYTYVKGKFLTEMTKSNRHEDQNIYPKEEFWEIIEDPNAQTPLEAKILLSYCDALTKNQTKWVLFTCLEDMSIKDIAIKENVSISAVKLWRKGAKEKLRGMLHNIL